MRDLNYADKLEDIIQQARTHLDENSFEGFERGRYWLYDQYLWDIRSLEGEGPEEEAHWSAYVEGARGLYLAALTAADDNEAKAASLA